MRKVYYAPLVHRMNEMVSGISGMIERRNYDIKLLDEWTDSYFSMLEKKAEKLKGRVDKIYEDGWNYGHERHVKAIKDSNRQLSILVRSFAEEGARLMKTESTPHVETMLVICDLSKKLRSKRKWGRLQELRAECNAQRNLYVAHRIDVTLREGEEAILFMGAAHNILFDDSITVEYLYDPAQVCLERERVERAAYRSV